MAERKERHGLRRAGCRGRSNVRIQAWGAAMAYNIKKLVRAHRQRLHEPAATAERPATLAVAPPVSIAQQHRSRRQPSPWRRQPPGRCPKRHLWSKHRSLAEFGNRPWLPA